MVATEALCGDRIHLEANDVRAQPAQTDHGISEINVLV